MLPAVHRRLVALEIVHRFLCAGVAYATSANDVNHAVFSMLLAVYRLHALDVEAWLTRTGFIRATLVANVHYAIVGMLLAIHSSCIALEIEARFPCAGVV